MRLSQISYVHFYVPDANYWRDWCCNCLDFYPIAAVNSIQVAQQGAIQFWFSDLRLPGVEDYLAKHGAGIVAIGLNHGDRTLSYAMPNSDLVYQLGNWSFADLGFSLFSHIDHLVINLPAGTLGSIASWHKEHLELEVSDRFQIQTEHSGLESLVLQNPDRSVQIPLNQPTTSSSQIQEFLDYHGGAGVQHLALHTPNIEQTVATLRSRGVQFLPTQPPILFEQQDDNRAIAQIFTLPLFGQPTFFLEIIQRYQGATGFGAGNFQALFEAIESQQLYL
ncbi:MAG: VOC family protein [Pseudanabaenaceae cyanobacterium bins.68]|nr:VOC family protein [Pseudanabaenaceae cyanobacterium bins.68]